MPLFEPKGNAVFEAIAYPWALIEFLNALNPCDAQDMIVINYNVLTLHCQVTKIQFLRSIWCRPPS